ncbi:MAG TPA: FtsX-like permease family protein [Gaiellaceae bacterium]|nr:FtsX-like permease family protein [Gaiellaceae bacterium]
MLGLELRLPENEAFTHAHQEAEGEVSAAPSGVLTLGKLVADGSRAVSNLGGWTLAAGGEVTQAGARTTISFAFEDTSARLFFRPAQATDKRSMPVVVSRDIARAAGGVGRQTVLDFQDVQVPARVVGIATRLPGVPSDSPFVLAAGAWLSTAIGAGAPGEGTPNEVWLAAPRGRAAVAAGLRRPPFSSLVVDSRSAIERQLADDPLAHATALALGTAGIVALALAVLGFWVGVISELRDERSDFFDLEAQGLSPGSLRSQLRTRSVLLVGLGLAGGAGLGALLAQLVVSLVRVSGTTDVPEPPLRFDPAWLVSGLGVGALAVAALLVAEGTSLGAFRADRPERASWSLE